MTSNGPDVALAVIYCKYEKPPVAFQTVTRILGSISAQVLRRATSLPRDVLDIYETRTGSEKPTPEQVKKMVLAAIRHVRGAYLVVDGLDELNPDVRTELLKALDNMENERIKTVVFSRFNINEIRHRSTHKNSVEISPERAEILDFLNDEIANNEKMQRRLQGDADIAEKIAQKIADKAGKSFVVTSVS
jgi:hypothetical protein